MELKQHDASPALMRPAREGDADERGLALAMLMDELGHGVLLLGPGERLLHANEPARQELARHGLGVAPEALLKLLAPHSRRALQEALRKTADGKRSLLTIAGPHGTSLAMVVLPLKASAHADAAHTALVLARSALCDPLTLGMYARSQGLTGAEEQVLGVLCQGCSAPEAARLLNVAVSTVRSHVRSLCAKTRSSGVRELVGRVAMLPPIALALSDQPVH